MGGEYRSIHFRTSALGQGSRTALPIVGRFFGSAISDDRFARYRKRFMPPTQHIDEKLWDCAATYDVPAEGISGIPIQPIEGISIQSADAMPIEKPAMSEPSNLPPPIDIEIMPVEE